MTIPVHIHTSQTTRLLRLAEWAFQHQHFTLWGFLLQILNSRETTK